MSKESDDLELDALSHRLQQLLDGDPESKIFDIRRDTITEIVTTIRARTAQPVVGQWQPIETAPYDTPVRVKLGNATIIAAVLRKDASMNTDLSPCDQWQAYFEGEHPECWTDGACWESNSSGAMSLQPTAWAALLPEGGA